jgi:ribosomal protein L37AE/L43A
MTDALRCPHCGGQAFTDYGDGLVACQRCYAQFDLNQQLCPHCGSLLAEGAFVCLQCGADLRGDGVRRTLEERLMTARDWQRLRRAQVSGVRTDAEATSRQRLEAWWEADRKRQADERQMRLARQSRGRRVLIVGTAIVVVLLLLVVLIGLLASSSNGPDPTPTAWLLHQACQIG